MHERLLIAGSGGQGIILIGRLLATVAVKDVPHVTFFPSYGAEVRGGVSSCQVVLSSREIASPVSETFDSLLILNQQSADRFLPLRAGDGLAIINGSLCRVAARPEDVVVRATALANEIGDPRAANFVMLGAYLAQKPVVSAAEMEAGIAGVFGNMERAVADVNLKAFRLGLQGGENR